MTPAEREAHEARCATLRAAGLSLAELRAWSAEHSAIARACDAVADALERGPASLPDTIPAPPPETDP